MPVSGSTPHSPPSASPSASKRASQDRSTHNNPREDQRQRDDFQRKLQNREANQKPDADKKASENTEGKQRQSDAKTGRRDEDAQSFLAKVKSKEEKRHDEKLAALGQNHGQAGALHDNGQIAGQASAASDIDPALQSQLDRIAAAIAEMSAKDAQSKYTLQLPGSSPIESAVLAKNAAGFISILLVARPGMLDRQQRRQIRAELDAQLKNRSVKLGDIGFAGDPDKRQG